MPFLSLFLAACTADKPDDTADTADSADTAETADSGDSGDSADSSADGGETGAPDYHGTVPSDPTAAPTFSVLNQDEQVRTRDDLLGHPTVMWFYPAAATSG